MPSWFEEFRRKSPPPPEARRPRGILPDAMDDTRIVLIKACGHLRLTYELKLATYFAATDGRTLILAINKDCQLDPSAEKHCRDFGVEVRRS